MTLMMNSATMTDLPKNDMMGGSFGPELKRYNNFPHTESSCCALLSSGRAALDCLLSNMPRPRRVLIPRFICDTVTEPLQRMELPIVRYQVTEQLEPCPPPDADSRDLLLLVNYFGLTGEAVHAAALRHPGPVIVDATTALFTPSLPGIPTFYSPRKFGGLCDGGVACAPFPLELPTEQDYSAERMLGMWQRAENGLTTAAEAIQQAEDSLSAPPRRMSALTRILLQNIDWQSAARKRLQNYATLHAALAPINRLQLPPHPAFAPMCYPLVCGIPGLRDELIDAGVALPLYWPEVIAATSADETENRLARTLLPLPLDQRYTPTDMQWLIERILG